MDWLAFINQYGINILTVLVVVVVTQADTIKGWLQQRLNVSAKRAERDDDLEQRAWQKVFNGVDSVPDLWNRLFLQQENFNTRMRERDQHIERFTTGAVEAMQSFCAVSQNLTHSQKERDRRMLAVLDEVSHRMSGIGLIMGFYLHDRQGIDFDELLTAIRKTKETKDNPI